MGEKKDQVTGIKSKPVAQLRDGILVAVAIVVITYFHYYPPHLDFTSHENFHILLRRLYYIPIIYAAFRFGIKGGLLASLSVTALFIPQAVMPIGVLPGEIPHEHLVGVLLFS